MARIRWTRLWIALVAVAIIATAVPVWAADQSSVYDEVKKILAEKHVSGVSENELKSDTIDGLLEELNDPYTDYLDKNEYEGFRNSIEQNYVGIGVRIGQDELGVYIVEVFPNSPASEADVKPGDYIFAVNGKPSAGKTTDALVSEITGPEGTGVEVTVLRGEKTLPLSMVRRSIQIPVITSRYFENDKVGYLKISSFSFDLGAQLRPELDKLDGQGMQALIIDLRNNPGGYLHAATAMIRNFVEEGVLIHTKDRNGLDTPLRFSNGRQAPYPVYILANESSASASEVFAGAMQDYEAGVVIGRKTFGKGSVQQLEPLTDGGVLKVTIEEYLTPNQRRVNGVGIEPDVDVYGALPQLLTALRLAGVGPIELAIAKQGTTVNGLSFLDATPILEKDGTTYVPSRVLAAIVGAGVSWDSASKSVVIEADGAKATFVSGSKDMTVVRGTSYVDLSSFRKQFAGLSVAKADGRLVLTAE